MLCSFGGSNSLSCMPCVALANVEYLTIYDFLVQGSSRRKKGLGDGGIWKGGAAELHACTGLTEGSQARLAMCVIPKYYSSEGIGRTPEAMADRSS